MVRNNTTVFWLPLMAILCAAVQMSGYINLDDAWLLDVARRFVAGQELNAQVVETNPPLIVYINALPVLAAKILQISNVNCFIIFTTLIGLASCALVFCQVKDTLSRLIIGFGVFLLPNIIFGEREHFLIMLILPYFFSQTKTEKPGVTYSVIIGLMAGIGFSIKPFFAVIWLAIIICKENSDRKIFSLENFLIGGVGLSYLLFLVFIEKNYVANVLPLLLKYYGNFGTNTVVALKESSKLMFAYQVSVLVLFIKDRPALNRRICFSSAACAASVFIMALQSKTWLNYFYPPFFFSLLSNAFIIIAVFPRLNLVWNKAALIISSITIIILLAYTLKSSVEILDGQDKEFTERMVQTLNKKAAGKAVYPISFDLTALYPAVIYSKAHNVSQYGHLWMLFGMYENGEIKNGEMVYNLPAKQNVDEARIFKRVITDLINQKPALIAVTAVDNKYLTHGHEFKFDFIKYFSGDPDFKAFWKNYKKTGRIDAQEIYERQHNS